MVVHRQDAIDDVSGEYELPHPEQLRPVLGVKANSNDLKGQEYLAYSLSVVEFEQLKRTDSVELRLLVDCVVVVEIR